MEPKCCNIVQVDLAKASTSQDRLERQLDILQVRQKQITDALGVMEAEAEHLSRYCCTPTNPFLVPPLLLSTDTVCVFLRTSTRGGTLDAHTRTSQETLYSLAESISAHLSSLGDALHGIIPSDTGVDEVRMLTAVWLSTVCIDFQLSTGIEWHRGHRTRCKPFHRRNVESSSADTPLYRTKGQPRYPA